MYMYCVVANYAANSRSAIAMHAKATYGDSRSPWSYNLDLILTRRLDGNIPILAHFQNMPRKLGIAWKPAAVAAFHTYLKA